MVARGLVCGRHKEDRKAAKESIASASAQREKEAEAFAGESSELKTNIAASGRGLSGQSPGVVVVFRAGFGGPVGLFAAFVGALEVREGD